MEKNEISIRKYKTSDKPSLRYICKETAWDSYKARPNKLEGVCIMFNDYYTEHEPEHIWVAVNKNDEPIGYVISKTNYQQYKKVMEADFLTRLQKVSFEDVSFFTHFLNDLELVSREYPVHFHIDILSDYQRKGIGHLLLTALVKQLKDEGYKHLMLYAHSKESVGYKFYVKYGFKEVYEYANSAVALAYEL